MTIKKSIGFVSGKKRGKYLISNFYALPVPFSCTCTIAMSTVKILHPFSNIIHENQETALIYIYLEDGYASKIFWKALFSIQST